MACSPSSLLISSPTKYFRSRLLSCFAAKHINNVAAASQNSNLSASITQSLRYKATFEPATTNEQIASTCPQLDASNKASLKHDGNTSWPDIDANKSFKFGLFSRAALLISSEQINDCKIFEWVHGGLVHDVRGSWKGSWILHDIWYIISLSTDVFFFSDETCDGALDNL